jgi:hypothetical protein
VVVEGVDHDPEGHLLLELGGPAPQGVQAPPGRVRGQLAEQPRLARTRIPGETEETAGSAVRGVERLPERTQRVPAPH